MSGQEIDPMTTALILLSSGGYSTLLIIGLSLVISVVAFVKKINSLGYVFLLPPFVLVSSILLYRTASPDVESIAFLMKGMRHVGRLVTLLPFVVVLIMLLRAEKRSN